jgi:hypothetical protein
MPAGNVTTKSRLVPATEMELNIEPAGVPAVTPPEMCYLGWQESPAQPAQLIEPEIAG